METKNHRQFWICTHGQWYDDYETAHEEQLQSALTHVIEYSAFKELEERLKIADAALEFYADGYNWEHIAPDKVDYRVINKSDFGIGDFKLSDITDDEWVGGRTAREALKKIRGEG